ncbi:PapC/FimD family outer membrane usher protein [Salmonella enterica subsp. enterica serovar Claibornei]|nr:PapC/FimD family outer membrane usher protein [Salmonella enterica subsp. enterica serovar Claibornei]
MLQRTHFPLQTLTVAVLLALTGGMSQAEEFTQFNTQFLDVKEGTKVDLNRFSRKGYVMPGKYALRVAVNKYPLGDEYNITWYADENDPANSYPCLSPELVSQFGFRAEYADKLVWIKDGQCLKPGQLEGMDTQAELGVSMLNVIVPQAYLEYTDTDWDPPSRWDEGIAGLLFDYNLNTQWQHSEGESGDEQSINGNGTVGANYGPWRLRADWQADYNKDTSNDDDDGDADNTRRDWDWTRLYAYRALPSLGAQLSLGESSLVSDIFDTFDYAGASIITQDQMLPPRLRGYAPDVAGVARSNARVVISQQGRILYDQQVPAGPFRIQDIDQSVSGDLHVRIEEQGGQVQEYDVSTASIPFLTRPGQVRYKVEVGRPQDWDRHMEGDMFAGGEVSWGIADGWSLYGGGIGSQDYQALALGIGRDMAWLGALSVDVTHSSAKLPQDSGYGEGTTQGNSYRVSYAKDIDAIHGRFTFAGYRFSEENFMTMNDYLDASDNDHLRTGHDKEMYTASYNQVFPDLNVSAYLTYTHRSYWDRESQSNYNVMLSYFFSVGSLRNVSVSLNGYRNEYDDDVDKGSYLSISIPWGNDATVSYNGQYNKDNNSNKVSYYQRLDERNNYQVSAGHSSDGGSASGYYSHDGNMADVDVSASYEAGSYSSAAFSLQGGMTLTANGGALHRMTSAGGTRLLVDTQGVADVPVGGYDAPVYSNHFGKAVLPDVNNYSRSQARIDLDNLPENAESTQSVVQATLTEGAIGYRQFAVISGQKAMAVVRLSNGQHPPFGAEVKNARGQQVGLLDEDGNVYLAGVNAGEEMQVIWDGEAQCSITLPDPLPADLFSGLLLPCHGGKPTSNRVQPEIKPAIQEQTQQVTPSAKPEAVSLN